MAEDSGDQIIHLEVALRGAEDEAMAEEWGSNSFDIVGGNIVAIAQLGMGLLVCKATAQRGDAAGALDKSTQVVEQRIGKDELAGRSR